MPEELYLKLKAKKELNESFPDLIRRLLKEQENLESKHHIEDLAGAFDDESDEWEKITEELYQDRLRPSNRKNVTFEDD